MSVQPIPPSTGPTTAGQLAARATQNDQFLSAWLDDHEGRVAALESGSGTSGSLIVRTASLTTIPAPTTQPSGEAPLAGYMNGSASPITVSGATIESGGFAVFAWVNGSWVTLNTGTGEPIIPDTEAPTAPTIGTLVVAHASIGVPYSGGTDNVYVTRYRVRVVGGTWAVIDSPAPGTYTISGLTPQTAYTVEVQAGDAAGNWSVSATKPATTTAAPQVFNTVVVNDTFNRTPQPKGAGDPSYTNNGSFLVPANAVADSGQSWTGPEGALNGTLLVGDGTVMTAVDAVAIQHNIAAATTVQSTAVVRLAANTEATLRIYPKAVEGTRTSAGLGIEIIRRAADDYVSVVQNANTPPSSITYNLNNGTANWARMPGYDYTQDKVYTVRMVVTASTINVYVNEVLHLTATHSTALTNAPWIFMSKGTGINAARLDSIDVRTA